MLMFTPNNEPNDDAAFDEHPDIEEMVENITMPQLFNAVSAQKYMGIPKVEAIGKDTFDLRPNDFAYVIPHATFMAVCFALLEN